MPDKSISFFLILFCFWRCCGLIYFCGQSNW